MTRRILASLLTCLLALAGAAAHAGVALGGAGTPAPSPGDSSGISRWSSLDDVPIVAGGSASRRDGQVRRLGDRRPSAPTLLDRPLLALVFSPVLSAPPETAPFAYLRARPSHLQSVFSTVRTARGPPART